MHLFHFVNQFWRRCNDPMDDIICFTRGISSKILCFQAMLPGLGSAGKPGDDALTQNLLIQCTNCCNLPCSFRNLWWISYLNKYSKEVAVRMWSKIMTVVPRRGNAWVIYLNKHGGYHKRILNADKKHGASVSLPSSFHKDAELIMMVM